MIAWLVFFFVCAVEAFESVFFYDSFIQCRWGGVKRTLAAFILFVAGAGNAMLFEALPYGFIPWKLAALIVIHTLFVRITYPSDWTVSIFFSAFNIVIQVLIESIVIGAASAQYSEEHIMLSLLGSGICILWTGVLYLLRKKLCYIKQYMKRNIRVAGKLGMLPLISVIAGIYYYVLFILGNLQDSFHISVAAGLVIINVVSLFFLQESLVKDEKLRISEMQNENNHKQIQAFHDMQSLYERQGRKLHDYKKQLATIQELIKNGNVDTAIEFTEKLTKSIAVEASEVNVGHPVVNAVLNQQYRVAKGKNIGMSFAVSDLHDIRLADEEIVVLLGNLIENAIHECERVIDKGKAASISIKLVEKDGTLILTVRNPISRRVDIEGNRVMNPKHDGQGIGLLNVESVAEKNGGSFVISCDEKEFVAVVMI